MVGYISLGKNSTNILERVVRRDGNNSGNSNDYTYENSRETQVLISEIIK